MSGPNSTSSMPPAPYECESKESDTRKICDFILAHITCRQGSDVPSYCLDLGKNSKFYVMRECSREDDPDSDIVSDVFNPGDPDSRKAFEEELKRHNFSNSELIIVFNVNEEAVRLHVSKNKPFMLNDSCNVSCGKTRKRILRNLSCHKDHNPNNPD